MDFTNLSVAQFALIALAVAGIDFVVSVVAAIWPPNVFSAAVVARVLETHVLKRVLPIAGLAFLAQTFPAGDPQHLVVWTSACGALALYVAETVKSLASSVGVAQDMSAEVPFVSEPVPDEADTGA